MKYAILLTAILLSGCQQNDKIEDAIEGIDQDMACTLVSPLAEMLGYNVCA